LIRKCANVRKIRKSPPQSKVAREISLIKRRTEESCKFQFWNCWKTGRWSKRHVFWIFASENM